jgi:hypothetical protein
MLALDVGGIQVPDTRLVFLAALAVHLAAAATAVVAGALAATARKRAGRHPRAGTVYLWALSTVFATAAVLAGMRWRHDAHLFAIATLALTFGLVGWRARRRHRPGWVRPHAVGLGGSYIALLTGFYVDNGPQMPLWDRLPHLTYWLLPAAVGTPLIWLALHRFHKGVTAHVRQPGGHRPRQQQC